MSQNYIYGEWRGLPARQNQETGERFYFKDNYWQGPLAFGYKDEFKRHADEEPSDQWEQLHAQ